MVPWSSSGRICKEEDETFGHSTSPTCVLPHLALAEMVCLLVTSNSFRYMHVYAQPCTAAQLWFSIVKILPCGWHCECACTCTFGVVLSKRKIHVDCDQSCHSSNHRIFKRSSNMHLCGVSTCNCWESTKYLGWSSSTWEESARQWVPLHPSICSLCQSWEAGMCRGLGHMQHRD